MASNTKNLQYLKSSNQAAIYKHLATCGSCSRAELSRELGLSRMAITNLVSDMIQTGLVVESTAACSHSGSGRKSIALEIPDNRINAVGLLIERFCIHCNAMDIKGSEFYRDSTEIPENATNQDVVDIILSLLSRLFASLKDFVFSGIGISSVGPVDIETCTILHPPNFYKISDLPLGEILTAEYDLPVFMLNCMSAAALAERLYGSARNCRNLVYIGFGTGVGSGAIINNKLFTGSKGFAGELGHVSIDPVNGPLCSCGQRGCLETYTSTQILLQKLNYPNIDSLAAAVEAGDLSPDNTKELQLFYQAVLTSLITAANIYDPEMIVGGDQGSPLIVPFLHRLRRELNCLMIQHGTRTLLLSPSAFGIHAALAGAPSIVFDKIFARNLPPFNFT